MRKSAGIVRLVCTGLCVALIVGAAWFVISQVVMYRRVESRIAEMRRRGEPVSREELAGTPIPDRQNAAPTFEKAFDILSSDDARSKGLRILSLDLSRPDSIPWNEISGMLKKNGDALAILQHAGDRPSVDFGFARRSGSVRGAVRCGRIMALKAAAEARAGKSDAAAYWVTEGLRLGSSLMNESSLAYFRGGAEVITAASQGFGYLLRSGNMDPAQAERIRNQADRIDSGRAFVKALMGQRALGLSAQREWPVLARAPLMLGYIDTMSAVISSADDPSPAALEEVLRRARESKMAGQNAVLVEDIKRSRTYLDRARANLGGIRICLSLLRRKRTAGRYPQTMDQLGGSMLTGKHRPADYTYRRRGQGFELIYAGSNAPQGIRFAADR